MPVPLPYPLLLNLQDRPVLVVGAGSVALRKTRSLLNAGARVTLVAPQIHPDLLALQTQHSELSTQHSSYFS